MVEVHRTKVMFILLCIQWKTLFEQRHLYTQRIRDDNLAAFWTFSSPGMGWQGSGLDGGSTNRKTVRESRHIRKEKLTSFGTTRLDKEESVMSSQFSCYYYLD